MALNFFTYNGRRRQLLLDPRTKLLLLVVVSSLMLGGGSTGLMKWCRLALSLLPIVLFLIEHHFKTACKYFAFYILCFIVEQLTVNYLTGTISFLLLAVCSIMTKFAPGIMMGAFFLSTTTVSEFIAAMERMHVSEKITIPLAVIFRFFPTIGEEYHAISDAMRMRQIRLGRRGLWSMVEYRIMPLMISMVKIGDELSAAALTRGLGAPVKRTNICDIGFHVQDLIAFFLCLVSVTIFIVQRLV